MHGMDMNYIKGSVGSFGIVICMMGVMSLVLIPDSNQGLWQSVGIAAITVGAIIFILSFVFDLLIEAFLAVWEAQPRNQWKPASILKDDVLVSAERNALGKVREIPFETLNLRKGSYATLGYLGSTNLPILRLWNENPQLIESEEETGRQVASNMAARRVGYFNLDYIADAPNIKNELDKRFGAIIDWDEAKVMVDRYFHRS